MEINFYIILVAGGGGWTLLNKKKNEPSTQFPFCRRNLKGLEILAHVNHVIKAMPMWRELASHSMEEKTEAT